MMEKNEDLLQIETCFAYIKSGEETLSNLNQIETILKRLFDVDIHVNLVKNENNKFFGISVYPGTDTMDKIVDKVVNIDIPSSKIIDIWANNKEWYLEIDSLLLNGFGINASPSECVGLMLHEIGRVIYSNTIIQSLINTIRFKVVKLNYVTKKILENQRIKKLFYLSIMEICNTKNFSYKDEASEKVSDRFVVQYDYREELDNFLEKLISVYGNNMINRTSDDVEIDTKVMVNWVILNIRKLEFRKKELRETLKVEIMTTPSPLAKRVLQNIYVSFFGTATDKYRELLSEQFNEVATDVVSEIAANERLEKFFESITQEAALSIFDKMGRIKKVNQLDIDIIYADISRISTTDDKIYLLDKVYIQMDKINTALDYIEMGKTDKVKQSKSTLQNMKKQLERIRQEILATRIVDKQYGVFIKYPVGYQG